MRAKEASGGTTTWFGKHTDPQIISVLRCNSVPDLQVALRDVRWLPVELDSEVLFVNVGDAMQVMKNGRYRSMRHKVVVPLEAGERVRLSMIYFGGPALCERIEPVEVRLYWMSFTWREYKAAAGNTTLAHRRLDDFLLNAKESLKDS